MDDRATITYGTPMQGERSLAASAHRWALPLAGIWGISLGTATGRLELGPTLEIRILLFMTTVAAMPIAIARWKLAEEETKHALSTGFGRVLALSLFAPVATLVEITDVSSRSYAVAGALIGTLGLVVPVLARKAAAESHAEGVSEARPRLRILSSPGGFRR